MEKYLLFAAYATISRSSSHFAQSLPCSSKPQKRRTNGVAGKSRNLIAESHFSSSEISEKGGVLFPSTTYSIISTCVCLREKKVKSLLTHILISLLETEAALFLLSFHLRPHRDTKPRLSFLLFTKGRRKEYT